MFILHLYHTFMNACVSKHMHIACTFLCICLLACVSVCVVWLFVHVCPYVCVCLCVCGCVRVVRRCTYKYIYMYKYTCIHIHVRVTHARTHTTHTHPCAHKQIYTYNTYTHILPLLVRLSTLNSKPQLSNPKSWAGVRMGNCWRAHITPTRPFILISDKPSKRTHSGAACRLTGLIAKCSGSPSTLTAHLPFSALKEWIVACRPFSSWRLMRATKRTVVPGSKAKWSKSLLPIILWTQQAIEPAKKVALFAIAASNLPVLSPPRGANVSDLHMYSLGVWQLYDFRHGTFCSDLPVLICTHTCDMCTCAFYDHGCIAGSGRECVRESVWWWWWLLLLLSKVV